ncbi:hypothetical protein ADMFC3_19210 [Geovibrio sp. ADMFC3]
MNKNIKTWRLAPFLSVDDAMNLIIGVLPGTYKFDYVKDEDKPKEGVPIYEAMINDIQKFNLSIYFGKELACHENIGMFVSLEEYDFSCWWNTGKLSIEELKKWLVSKNIKSEFFETTSKKNISANMNIQECSADLYEINEALKQELESSKSQLTRYNHLVIGILLEFIIGDLKESNPKNQTELIDLIVEKYYSEGVKGVSDRSLKDKFSKGNKEVKVFLEAMLKKAKDQHDNDIKI